MLVYDVSNFQSKVVDAKILERGLRINDTQHDGVHLY